MKKAPYNPEGKEKPLCFSRNLCLLRTLYGMTQKEVASLLHVDRTSYTYYELGKTEPPYYTLIRLAAIYGTTTDMLLTEDIQEILQEVITPKKDKED